MTVGSRDDGAPRGDRQLSLARLAGLGLANAGCLVGGLVLGHVLDGWLGTAPVLVLVGLTAGLVLGAAGSFLEIRRHLQD
ncbi:MAG: AtpZ/AtpI family protein [Actinomycetota bacterium]|nr:AtpZ/AtpI family protein [Actinomycetota bacterium]